MEESGQVAEPDNMAVTEAEVVAMSTSPLPPANLGVSRHTDSHDSSPRQTFTSDGSTGSQTSVQSMENKLPNALSPPQNSKIWCRFSF